MFCELFAMLVVNKFVKSRNTYLLKRLTVEPAHVQHKDQLTKQIIMKITHRNRDQQYK